MKKRLVLLLSLILLSILFSGLFAVQNFPPPEFESDYQMPILTLMEQGRASVSWADVVIMAVALAITSWLVLKKRSRQGIWLVMIFSLVYFGFWKKGCICPIGAIQNMALGLFSDGYAVPLTVIIIFLLPLVFALFSGRVFCAGVCPLGAIQDVVAFFPIQIPMWLEKVLQAIAWLYLTLAILLAAMGSGFIICRYDPFVPFFRMSGSFQILLLGGALLVVGLFVARPYCRFLCPYGVLLGWLSKVSRRHLTITPRDCIQCRLCEDSCPFNAIEKPLNYSSSQVSARARIRLILAVLSVPVLALLLGWAGRGLSGKLSQSHYWVRLAQEYRLEEMGVVTEPSDMTDAFRTTGWTRDQLYEKAETIRQGFDRGCRWAGILLGIALGIRLVRMQVYDRHDDYRAEAGRCLSCGRCLEYCPVGRADETVVFRTCNP